MKKIKRPFLFALSGIVVQLLSLVYFTAPAYAAPARCYVGTGETFRLAAGCEPTNPRHAYYDAAGTRITATTLPDDTCYQQDTAVTGGVRYNANHCSTLSTLATQVERNLCENSGGEWVVDSSRIDPDTGNIVMGCTCPSGDSLQNGSCEVAPVQETPADDGAGSADPGRIASRPNDCDPDNLDGSNCGIIAYLNIFMNFVSGGIAIAVIGNIIYAGIQYSMAQGDPGNVGKAKTRIRNALLAFIMYVSLFGFLQWLIPGGVF